MYKFLVVLAVVACAQAASVPSENVSDMTDIYKTRMMTAFENEDLEVTIEGLEKAMRLAGVSEASKQCLKEQLDKVKGLAQHVDESLKACVGDSEPEVRAVLEKLQDAFQAAGVAGNEAAGKFQECLKLLPNLIKFNRCAKDVLHLAAGSAGGLAKALAETGLALAKLGAGSLACSAPVLQDASQALAQISLDALKCLGKRD